VADDESILEYLHPTKRHRVTNGSDLPRPSANGSVPAPFPLANMVPEVEREGDAIVVNVPTERGSARFQFSQITQSRGALDTVLVASLPSQPLSIPHFQRINLMSTSARAGLVKALSGALGATEWEPVIARAFWHCRETFLGSDRGGWLDDNASLVGPDTLVDPLVLAKVQNLVYGQGGTLKSYLGLIIAFMVSTGLPVHERVAEAFGPVVYLDYEADKQTFDRRWTMLCRFLGLGSTSHAGVYYLPGRGIPLADQIDLVARRVEREGSPLLIIDSASRATAGLNSDEASVGVFFAAGDSIPAAKFTIGHLNRAGKTDQSAGVAAWRNAPRRTWAAEIIRDGREDGAYEVNLLCTKSNEAYPAPVAYCLGFSTDNTLTFRWAQGRAKASENLKDQIWDALAEPMSIDDLRKRLGLPESKRESLRVTLYQGRRAGLYAQAGRGEKWGRASGLEAAE
jgi:hypothetical protein